MANHDGTFIWYELMTTDPLAAAAFYRTVVGWQTRDSGLTDRNYTELLAGETPVGGLMAVPAGARPAWLGYIAVDNVDAVADRIATMGGKILRAGEDIPGIGRFAVVADPQGAVFMLFTGAGEMPTPSAAAWTPGRVGWRELMAADGPTAFDFYAKLFGWTKAEAMDMGPMGVYQIFAIHGENVGGMMTKPVENPAPPRWQFYFVVESIDAAVDRVRGAGGQVLMGPQDVPGDMWIIQGLDPQGAAFALVGPRIQGG